MPYFFCNINSNIQFQNLLIMFIEQWQTSPIGDLLRRTFAPVLKRKKKDGLTPDSNLSYIRQREEKGETSLKVYQLPPL